MTLPAKLVALIGSGASAASAAADYFVGVSRPRRWRSSKVVAPFDVVNENGQRVFLVDQGQLSLFNASGTRVMRVIANENGGYLQALSATAPLSTTIGASGERVGVLVQESKPVASLTVGEAGNGRFELTNAAGELNGRGRRDRSGRRHRPRRTIRVQLRRHVPGPAGELHGGEGQMGPVVARLCAFAVAAVALVPALQARTALPEVLKSAVATYAALQSYADTGTIRIEVPGIVDEARITTRFRRATGDLYFEYQGLTSTNPGTKFTIDMRGHRTVVWMAQNEMQKYDFGSRTHEIVPPGNGQVQALQGLAYPTRGTSILIPSLLYPKAQLPSAILQLESAAVTGIDTVGGKRCHKIVGTAAARYPSGQRTGARPVTVWIDAEANLIRRVFEDTPEGYAPGAYQRTTITLEPQAGPSIPDTGFQFTPPA